MSQKGKQGRHGNVIREIVALRWEPTHITKHCPRVVPLHCASICCRVCGCVFQEDGIVVRSAGEEWYID